MTSRAQKAKSGKSALAQAKKPKFSFVRESIAELRKAHWPTRQEALRLSLLVLLVCVVVGVILGGLDYGFTKMVAALLSGG